MIEQNIYFLKSIVGYNNRKYIRAEKQAYEI